MRIAWSFYAGAVGSWVVTGPPSYSVWAGLLGLIMYAISAGIPIVIIAQLGHRITGNLPEALRCVCALVLFLSFLPFSFTLLRLSHSDLRS